MTRKNFFIQLTEGILSNQNHSATIKADISHHHIMKGGEPNMTNAEIKNKAKERGVPLWKIADALNVSEPTITRLFRHELSPEMANKIIDIIDSLSRKDGE